MTKTALYRHYDAQGRLLYVGITDCLHERDRKHVQTSQWHESVVRTETQWCVSREHALALEAVAIRFEAPMHNVVGKRPQVDHAGELTADAPAILCEVEEFMRKHVISKSAFGIKAVGDPSFVDDLRSGRRELRKKTISRVMEYMITGRTHAEVRGENA